MTCYYRNEKFETFGKNIVSAAGDDNFHLKLENYISEIQLKKTKRDYNQA